MVTAFVLQVYNKYAANASGTEGIREPANGIDFTGKAGRKPL
jgi:hypothetical protein